ncbi:MAG: IS3 family transposase [Actinobacteria bacterium]|nr:IS3 family transposase [Actinomycetota bacterium]
MSRGEQARLEARVARLEAEGTILRRLAALPLGGPERERVYRFIEANAAEFPVATLCAVTEVSRSAYYAWRSRGPEADEATWDEAALADQIFDAWAASRCAYGSPRVTQALWRAGVQVSEKRVSRLMAELGIAGRSGRRKLRTTRRDPAATPSPDLLERDFAATVPDEVWVGDITYIPTGEGFLFVASVIDVCSRLVVGWSIASHMRTEICTDALVAALGRRGRTAMDGTIFHSDHGSQYTSGDFRRFCARANITQSMGTVGDSYDNAMAESFWASLKRELVDYASFATKAEARQAIFKWIVWYNNERLHSSLGYVPPSEFEQSSITKCAA